ncbi:MAG: ACP S-malonyltransferase [Lautropia sp.]
MSLAFVFPGQGSQAVGMLASVVERPEVASLLRAADAALGESLSGLIADGPADALALTTNTQPAMLVAGLALLSAWRASGGPEPAFVAGHSLGEYTALAAAGAIGVDDALRVVRVRADAMQQAVPVGTGSMAAILGLSDAQVREVCARAQASGAGEPGGGAVVEPANYNAPSQVVIAGHKAAVERACAEAKALGAKRALPLAVSAPFHSSLLEPVAPLLRAALAGIALRSPRIDVVNNVDVAIEREPARIVDALVRQAYSPVRWVEIVQLLASRGVDRIIEIGPGKVLSGLVKRIAPQVHSDCVHDAASLERVLGELAAQSTNEGART